MVFGTPSIPPLNVVEVVPFGKKGKTCRAPRNLPNFGFDFAVASFPSLSEVTGCGSLLHHKKCVIYNFQTDSWKPAPFTLSQNRFEATSVLMGHGKMLVLGGFWDEAPRTTEVLSSDGTSHPGPKMPYASSYHCALKVNATHIFMAGGFSTGGASAKAYLLNIDSYKWTQLQDMKQARASHACGLVKGRNIVAAGGATGAGGDLASVEIYSLETGDWKNGTKLPMGMRLMAAVQLEETFMLVGGKQNKTYLDSIYMYNEKKDIFVKTKEKLKKGRPELLAVLVPEKFNFCPAPPKSMYAAGKQGNFQNCSGLGSACTK